MMGLLTEDFDWDFAHEIVTQKHSKEIYDLLLKMFPDQNEIITYHYNDELGIPFAEWKRKIHDIKDWVLEGPIIVYPDEIFMDEEDNGERFETLSTEREVVRNLLLLTFFNLLALLLAWVIIQLEPWLKTVKLF